MIFDKLEKNINNKVTIEGGSWSNFLKTYVSSDDLLKESTYNKCIKYTGESVAKCPLTVKKITDKGEVDATEHRLYDKLRLRANPFMTISDCLKTWICLGEHEGISALYKTKQGYLYPAKISKILVDDAGVIDSLKGSSAIGYVLDIAGQRIGALNEECTIYRSGVSWDNIRSVNANKDYLQDSTNTLLDGQNYLSKLFDNGMCSKVLVQLTSEIKTKGDLVKEQEKFNTLFNTDGKMFVAPAGTSISSLNMNLHEAQFKEIRSLSRIEIANAFGLTPSMIGEGEGDIEKDTLRYLQDTLLFKLEVLEQELDYKLLTKTERNQGYKIRFNTNVLLRTNAKTQQEIICEYSKYGIYSLEFARKLLGAPNDIENETVCLPSGQILLSDLRSGKASWQKDNNSESKGGE